MVILGMHYSLSWNSNLMVTNSLFISYLDDCNSFYKGLPSKTTWNLQLVQKTEIQIAMSLVQFAHMLSVLRELHCLPVDFKTLVVTLKDLRDLAMQYLQEYSLCM